MSDSSLRSEKYTDYRQARGLEVNFRLTLSK